MLRRARWKQGGVFKLAGVPALVLVSDLCGGNLEGYILLTVRLAFLATGSGRFRCLFGALRNPSSTPDCRPSSLQTVRARRSVANAWIRYSRILSRFPLGELACLTAGAGDLRRAGCGIFALLRCVSRSRRLAIMSLDVLPRRLLDLGFSYSERSGSCRFGAVSRDLRQSAWRSWLVVFSVIHHLRHPAATAQISTMLTVASLLLLVRVGVIPPLSCQGQRSHSVQFPTLNFTAASHQQCRLSWSGRPVDAKRGCRCCSSPDLFSSAACSPMP